MLFFTRWFLVTSSFLGALAGTMQVAVADDPIVLSTAEPITILSANDGETHIARDSNGNLGDTQTVRDSVTVIHLGPNHPPTVKTAYAIAPNTIWSAPYSAIAGNGRFGFVTNNGERTGAGLLEALKSPPGEPVSNSDLSQADLQKQRLSARLSNLVTVIDLESPDLKVVRRFSFDEPVWNAASLPNHDRVIVGCTNSFLEFDVADGVPKLLKTHPSKVGIESLAVSPRGDWIITHGMSPSDSGELEHNGIHAYRYSKSGIEYVCSVEVKPGLDVTIDRPFSPRISPDGKRALTLNGWGIPAKGSLDDVLSIDLTLDKPMVTEVVPQVGDGLESIAYSPDGKLAVVTCLNYEPKASDGASSLAVLDLTSVPIRLLYHTDTAGAPQGIEFSPSGDKLFVGSPVANRIVVYDVDGFRIKRSPFFLQTGHGHASMAISRR